MRATVTDTRESLPAAAPCFNEMYDAAGAPHPHYAAYAAWLEAKPLEEATEWLENYRRFWEESFQKLDTLLEEMKKKKR